MKRVFGVISLGLLIAIGAFAYVQRDWFDGGLIMNMMGGGSRKTGMMQMMQWMRGNEVEVDMSGPRPLESRQTVTLGQRVYEERCAVCHGENGDGSGKKAHMLNAKPRDFTLGVYKFRSTPSGSLPIDEDIYTTISRGLRGTPMLPWFGLSKREKWAVTYYIKTFSERFTEEESDTQIAIPEILALSAEVIDRGRQNYEQAKCWECHGRQGRGDGSKADELKDAWGHSIRPRDFTSEPFKRGVSMNDIFLTVATGLDGTPMNSYSDSMPADDILALSAYVKSLAGQRPGPRGGMTGMMSVTPDVRAGMMIKHPGMSARMMADGMMGANE